MFYKYPCSTAKACVTAGPGTPARVAPAAAGPPHKQTRGDPWVACCTTYLSVPAVLCILYTLTHLCMPGVMQWCYPSLHAWLGTCGHAPGTEQSCRRGAHATPHVPMKCGSWGRRQISLAAAANTRTYGKLAWRSARWHSGHVLRGGGHGNGTPGSTDGCWCTAGGGRGT